MTEQEELKKALENDELEKAKKETHCPDCKKPYIQCNCLNKSLNK